MQALFANKPYWAKRFGVAPVLPMSRKEMDALGWDSCDIILVTGDAYVDHPSFGMALIGRLLESQGFRVGILSQPDWLSEKAFTQLGKPNLFFGVTAGNMDSMVNRYTADRRIRSNDAYTADGEAGKRPDRSVIVYSQRVREAYKDVPVIIGGIEASLRRIAHFDYWSDKIRRSILPDSKADILVFGNAERQIVEIAHRLAKGENVADITDIRGTAVMGKRVPDDWSIIDSTDVDTPGRIETKVDPYASSTQDKDGDKADSTAPTAGQESVDTEKVLRFVRKPRLDPARTVIRIPSYEQVRADEVLYAHTSRILHMESNAGNARALIQAHGKRDIWINPPPIPLTTKEMDAIYELPYTRVPHPGYGKANVPAYEMIRFSVTIMRGCFGGCTFCSITEHEGRVIQNRSEDSIIREVETIRDNVPGFTGIISDLGGPTANMYRLACKSKEIEASCRRLSCVHPTICKNLGTNHNPLIKLYRRARELKGVKKVLVASGLRYDLAIKSPAYVKELVSHHVGGYLKIAPEHVQPDVLDKMMKPEIGVYDKFKELFEKYSKEAGKEQYLIPYFIAAHPGTTDEDMLQLALWLKKNGFRADQVQAFLPSPMSLATAMYHSGKNPLHKVSHNSESVTIPKGIKVRRLHKAFLRYHDAENWPLLREALMRMGREDLIGNSKKHLIPSWQPKGTGEKHTDNKAGTKGKVFRTQQTHGTNPKNKKVSAGSSTRKSVRKKITGKSSVNKSSGNKSRQTQKPGSPAGRGKRR